MGSVLVTVDDQFSGPIAEGSAEAARPRSAGRLGPPWGEAERVHPLPSRVIAWSCGRASPEISAAE